ncbi:oligosaccharide flippase family protein [Puniceibacterium sp. IMCC21224]|uniref:oligosaccharide flippase family protein n=1 Tax=Puniceibacterium sp. IMCC21224 TaxID=1618204 RepID=UPI00064DB6AF|nr:oligosaccharide flippase family protein [Puniceibacterium sp. IMCC21224]KMK63845.1 membrane protein involved in the export of O-antigen and teichoic acid [Puniceibacterium sp. IMCC21224]
MLRTALVILSGNALTSLLTLVRNLAVARMIPVVDYGIAATFAIAMMMVEMMSALGLQQQIVQARNGEDVRFQAGLQGFQMLRGAISALALFALAGPIAAFMKVPEATWGFQVMAVVPILNALIHFDMYRLNRSMIFGPGILATTVPALLSLISLWPLAHFYGDWRVMLWALILQAALTAVMSHVLARRPYRLVLDRAIMAQGLRFGWPILLNGMLLFLVFQGDRLIVGRELGMAVLAIFSMGLTLTLTPVLVLGRTIQNFFLPQLSAELGGAAPTPGRDPVFVGTVIMQLCALAGMILLVLTDLGADSFVRTVLGDKYADLATIILHLAVIQVVRILVSGYSTLSIAAGVSIDSMYPNLFRVAVLPFSWAVISGGGGLLALIYLAVAAECAGFLLAIALTRKYVRIPLRRVAVSGGLLVVAVAFTLANHLWGKVDEGLVLGVQVLLIAALIAAQTEFRRYFFSRAEG